MDYTSMFLFTLLSPIITAFITGLGNALAKNGASIFDWICKLFRGKENSIVIKLTKTFSAKCSHWNTDPHQYLNNVIIESIIDYMSKNGLYSDEMTGKIGQANGCNNSMSARRIELMPIKHIKHDGFEYNYSENATDTDHGKKLIISLRISSKRPTMEISNHIKQMYVDYTTKVYDRIVDSQFLYKLGNENLTFKKYPVNNLMTFDKMSFPEKAKILEMLNKLRAGEINKFSLLLHSSQGMGKHRLLSRSQI